MSTQQRYNEILFVIDTCQAATLYSYIQAPNIIGIGSSVKDESSYSYMNDQYLGISLVDRFTHQTLRFFESKIKTQNIKLLQLFNSYSYKQLHSHAKWDFINFKRDEKNVKITDFFSAVTYVELIKHDIIRNINHSKTHKIEKQSLLINTNYYKYNDNNNMPIIIIMDIIKFMDNWYNTLVLMPQYQLYTLISTIFCGLYMVDMNLY